MDRDFRRRTVMACLALGAAVFGPAAWGQSPPESSPPPADPAAPPAAVSAAPSAPIQKDLWVAPDGSLGVNLPSDQTLPAGILQFLVTHRFRSPVRGSDAHSLYSLDSGADFGFGFSYSPVSHTEISLYRSSVQDDWELAAKFSIRPGGAGSPLGAAVRLGGDDRRSPLVVNESGSQLPDARARTSFFAQGVLTLHLLADRLELSAVPTFSTRTTAEHDAFNVPVRAAIGLSRSWNLQGEYQAPRRGVNGSIAVWSVAVEKVLYHHRFELVVSNTTVTTVDQTLSGDFARAQIAQGKVFENGFRNNDWHIGFNLVRQFKP